MAYNYGPPPGTYGAHQPPYAPPGAAAPGMGVTPGPGYGAPPGFLPPGGVGGMPQGFQPPPNMPNINFNAPVIRLGLGDQPKMSSPMDRLAGGGRGGEGRGSNAEPLGGGRNRAGLGADRYGGDRNLDRERAAVRESMMAVQPPTREEVARTIFVGGLGEGTPDDGAIESILRCAGKLRRWTRAKDADDKPCKFGFAEYEDVDSLEAANEIMHDVELPIMKNGQQVKDEDGEPKKAKLLVVVDEQSKNYIDDWKGRRKEDDNARQFRIDGCKEDLRHCITTLFNAGAYAANGTMDGDVEMGNAPNGGPLVGDQQEVVTIQVPPEDDLADVPAEMRATVAEEIKAFRDRSTRRDLDRLRREEEMERAERQRSAMNFNRLASPPLNGAPAGPGSSANGIPVGPRGGVQGAPSGPKGFRGAQIPSDYVNGVAFVGANGATNGMSSSREEDDAEESDEELERRRQSQRAAEIEKHFREVERRWRTREHKNMEAQERTRKFEEGAERERARQREIAAKRMAEFDDDEEAKLRTDDYYYDRPAWLRNRAGFREMEEQADERDREMERRELEAERRRTAEARGLADDFLDQTASELAARGSADVAQQPSTGFGGFKLSLGSAAARSKAAPHSVAHAAPRKAMLDAEGLLDDEEDAAASGERTRPELRPLVDTSTLPSGHGQDLTDEERADARQQLASEIPTATAELFAYPLQWSHITSEILEQQIRPFVEKKVVEYLGVQEDLLVNTLMDGLQDRSKRSGAELVDELEPALEEEAEVLVRKVWRLLVFWGEVGKRGLD